METARSDRALLAALATGDRASFSLLFERHSDFVYSFAFRRTGSSSAAEDMVGTVLFELWRQRERVEVKHGSLRPWLAGVTLNQVRHWWRSGERQRRAFGRVTLTDTAEDLADGVASRLDSEPSLHKLLAALDALPAPQRDVLMLFVWEELSYEEIAETLGLALGTVRSRLSRARAQLRAIRVDETSQVRHPSSASPRRLPPSDLAAVECEGRCP